MRKIVFISLALFYVCTAQAYIDPGLLTVLYQGLYVLIFGAFSLFVLRPMGFFKELLNSRKKNKANSGPNEAAGQPLDSVTAEEKKAEN